MHLCRSYLSFPSWQVNSTRQRSHISNNSKTKQREHSDEKAKLSQLTARFQSIVECWCHSALIVIGIFVKKMPVVVTLLNTVVYDCDHN